MLNWQESLAADLAYYIQKGVSIMQWFGSCFSRFTWTFGVFVVGTVSHTWGQTVSHQPVPPDGPKQMAVLYTHGFNDDGAGWGTAGGADMFIPLTQQRLAYQMPATNNFQLLTAQGITNYAVQWTVTSPDEYSDPYATADEGVAFLADETQMQDETDWIGNSLALHNRARPSFVNVLTASSMDVLIPQYAPLEPATIVALTPLAGSVAAARELGRRTFYLGLTANRNTYNDSGRVDDHSTDLLDLLREERAPEGRLTDYRQINLVTHSKGSLVTRVMLSKAETAGREDAEYVANVLYNAPPFAGSSLTELLKFMYDGPIFLRINLANPWLAQTISELTPSAAYPNPRLGDRFRALLTMLTSTFGVDFSVLENQNPILHNQIELLNVFTAEAFLLSELANQPLFTPAGQTGALIADLINIARPIVTAAIGIPSFPTAREDLPPETAVNLLQNFPTASNAVQFINSGSTSEILGVPTTHLLWPTGTTAQIAADPTLIFDIPSQAGQGGDTYVSLSSAEFLANTSAFGPQMNLAGRFPTDHGGTTESINLMHTNWFSILLAPPTTLHMNGEIEELSREDRTYSVSPTTTFSFISSNFTATVTGGMVDIQAVHHQYRFVPLYLDDPVPTPWEQLDLSTSRSFDDAVIAHNLQDTPFEIQWRAVNVRGAREMIRSANIIVDSTPPLVTDVLLNGNTAEIVKRERNRLRGGNAIRSSYFDKVTSRATDLMALKAAPEPDWQIRNPAAKFLVAIFDKSGSVDYTWNDPTLSSPTTLTDVNALFLVLDVLTNGLNTLTFQPFTEGGGSENRGPVQTIRVFVDNTPPEHSLTGLVPDPIGVRVGPCTPLQYRVQDLESGSGMGSISVVGFTNASFASAQIFQLRETDVIDQIKAFDPISVGGFITLAANATDLVQNVSSTNFIAYFDFTAPTLTNVTVIGGTPTATGAQVFTNTVQIAVDVRDPNSSVLVPPCAVFENIDTEQATCSAPFTFEQSVGVFARYTGTVYLAKGVSAMQIVCRDVFGNINAFPLTIEYLDPPISTNSNLNLLTPRIDNENSAFFDPNGGATNFNDGAILSVDSSYDGTRFVFSSTGNGFVYGDNNQVEDVFVTERGRISRVSVGPNGEQAFGGESDNPSISGNGRYVYFESSATNLVAGTSEVNLYVKDLETGEIAVISRHFDGSPINRLFGTFDSAPTWNGRYVFFSGRNANYVDGLTDNNTGLDIYLVDLDPDGNGNYFDDNYVTHPISTVNSTTTGNNASREPCVSDDGRYLLFETQATDIDTDLALNGTTADALVMTFSGNALDGTLNVSNRTTFVVNRDVLFAQPTSGTTASGIMKACIASDGDTILFSTRSNIATTGDTNNEANQEDVYTSIGESFGVSIPNRLSSWQSRGVGGAQSVIPTGQQVGRLTVASNLRPASFFNNKVAWVSAHSNLVAGDGNLVADLFVGIAGGTGVIPLDPPAPNWVSSNITSSATVNDGGLTPDGRHAWWVSTQTYLAPFTPDRSHIYLRRIDPVLTNELTIVTVGNGSVIPTPLDTNAVSNVYVYTDTSLNHDTVMLDAIPDPGSRLDTWQNTDSDDGTVAEVRLLSDRTVTALFVTASAPIVGSLSITTEEDTVSHPVMPSITDLDPKDEHTLSVQSPPTNGTISVTSEGFIYTPDQHAFGPDSFVFGVTDRYALTTTGTATIVVQPVNDPPVVGAEITLAGQAGEIGPILPAFTDPDIGDTHVFSILVQPTHGTASADAAGLYYTSDVGYAGLDSFVFQVTDAGAATDTGSIQVNVIVPPSITNTATALASTNLAVEISTLPAGLGYTVEFKEKMLDPVWLPVPPTNQWPSTSASFGDLLSTQRFYRLKFELLDL